MPRRILGLYQTPRYAHAYSFRPVSEELISIALAVPSTPNTWYSSLLNQIQSLATAGGVLSCSLLWQIEEIVEPTIRMTEACTGRSFLVCILMNFTSYSENTLHGTEHNKTARTGASPLLNIFVVYIHLWNVNQNRSVYSTWRGGL